MQEPPPPPTDPTPPTRPAVTPGLPVASEAVYESELIDRVDRARFWANFGAAAAVLAAILGVIALIIAIQAKNDASNDSGSGAALTRQVDSLQSDVASLKSQSSSQSDTTKT